MPPVSVKNSTFAAVEHSERPPEMCRGNPQNLAARLVFRGTEGLPHHLLRQEMGEAIGPTGKLDRGGRRKDAGEFARGSKWINKSRYKPDAEFFGKRQPYKEPAQSGDDHVGIPACFHPADRRLCNHAPGGGAHAEKDLEEISALEHAFHATGDRFSASAQVRKLQTIGLDEPPEILGSQNPNRMSRGAQPGAQSP